jgi:hypothetical protein
MAGELPILRANQFRYAEQDKEDESLVNMAVQSINSF